MLGTTHIKSLSLSQYDIDIRTNQKSETQDRRSRNRYKNFTCDKASSKINIEMIVDIINYVWLFVTPWTVVCQAPLSMGFSRQEYWSGLPCSPPGDLSNSWIEPGSPTLQVDYLPSESSGKPKNTEVGSILLLQGIFPTQKLKRGLLHDRRIHYQLSCQGNPNQKSVKSRIENPEIITGISHLIKLVVKLILKW